MKKKTNHAQEIKAMAKAMTGKDIFPDVSLPKSPSASQKPTRIIRKTKLKKDADGKVSSYKNVMHEKQLEREIIFKLNMMGFVVSKAGEQATYNSKHVLAGMSDLLVFGKPNGVVFMEVKHDSNKQRVSQIKFQQMCETCGLKYVVVRSVKEAMYAVST